MPRPAGPRAVTVPPGEHAEPNLRPALDRAGWRLLWVADVPDRYLALAVRA